MDVKELRTASTTYKVGHPANWVIVKHPGPATRIFVFIVVPEARLAATFSTPLTTVMQAAPATHRDHDLGPGWMRHPAILRISDCNRQRLIPVRGRTGTIYRVGAGKYNALNMIGHQLLPRLNHPQPSACLQIYPCTNRD